MQFWFIPTEISANADNVPKVDSSAAFSVMIGAAYVANIASNVVVRTLSPSSTKAHLGNDYINFWSYVYGASDSIVLPPNFMKLAKGKIGYGIVSKALAFKIHLFSFSARRLFQ